MTVAVQMFIEKDKHGMTLHLVTNTELISAKLNTSVHIVRQIKLCNANPVAV